MPRTWIYFTALILPLVAHLIVLDTRFVLERLWYAGYTDYYNMLNELSVHPTIVEFFGGWPLPVFIGAVLCYWIGADEENIDAQFMLLPLVYAPFLVIGTALVNQSFDLSTLYSYPVAAILIGYLYIFPWVVFVRVFDKLHLVV
jgi:hypothetical protein